MRTAGTILLAVACLAGIAPNPLRAADGGVDYSAQVKPLLKARCYACHGALKQEGGLRLDTAASILKGGDSGKVISPDVPASSLLLERVSATDISVRMPPEHEGEAFKAEEVELLRSWIAAGAQAPADEQPEADPKNHWSFRPVGRPAEPAVKNAGWVRNPIDAWIAAGHEAHGLTPQPEASRIVLLRRLSMDLIGLPPTAEELAAIEADTSPQWYENAVDRLLDDPRHGERWARHWMDIWRYSDWWGLGAQLRNSQRHMWHWRDWIVESLNEDRPYDEMVRLMLAADELTPDDPDSLRATGFLARNYFIFNRNRWMEDVVTHVSKGLLGLTMNCSKCHDHKFDPISQEDYYRMRAFFEPYHVRVDMVPGETDLLSNGIPRVFDRQLEEPTYLLVRGDDALPDQSKPISPGVPALLAFDDLAIQPVTLPESASEPGRRSWVLENHVREARQQLKAAESKRAEAARKLKPTEQAALAAATGETPRFVPISETFETLDASRWKLEGDGWAHQPGKLEQKKDGPVSSTLALQQEPPRDFEATLRYQLVGGSMWRSVGLEFDVVDGAAGSDPGSRQVVYLSGAAGGSKIQGSFTKGGQWQYPADGLKALPVEVGKEYTLQVRVRDTLVNASVNGQPVLAWRTPAPRRPGALRVMTFDAIAVLHEFRLAALDSSVSMVEPSGSVALPPEQELELATADVEIAEARLKSLELCAAAVRAEHDHPEAPANAEARRSAILAERQLAVARARRDVLAAEQAAKQAADDKREEAEKKLAAANASLAAATAAAKGDVGPDDTLTFPLGAQWSATRFGNTAADDPQAPFPTTSTGRRTALAKWITDRRNPLTARVAVNHLWNRHFGAPLAPAPFDFGRNSPDPAHPELIDWLASEFMDQGWSMKHLHRLIVTSSTYRMSSSLAGGEANAARDPDNRYWWRRAPIRIESQAVRDAILALAGTLDPVIGGPSVPSGEQEQSKRRSLYFYHSNNERNLFLITFDEADVGECYRRDQSVVPQQALALTNSGLVLDASRQIASRITGSPAADEAAFVKQAFVVILGIRPGDAEVAASLAALEGWKSVPGTSGDQARSNLVWILLNHNDFVTLR